MMKTTVVLMAALSMMSGEAKAQSLKDLLNSQTVKNAVTAVTGGTQISVENLQGTWTYTGPAVQLEGDNVLKDITGSVAATEMEKKLKTYCDKVGIEEGIFNYTFNSDSTFTSQLKKGTLKGTYTFDTSAKTVSFNYSVLGSGRALTTLTARVVLSQDQLALLFDADKLMKFLTTLSSLTNSTALQAVTKLANEYDGMLVGFNLKK